MTDVRVGIVGLGRVGAGWPDISDVRRSHLSAARSTPGMRVTALVDRDGAALNRARALVADDTILCAADVGELPGDAADVLVDATDQPDRSRFPHTAAARGATLVILEKPVAVSLKDAAKLRAVATSDTTLRVNFHRRLDPRHRRLRPAQAPRLIQAVYGGGLLNYGSHLIDLMLDWMGPVTAVRASGASDDAEDPRIGFDLAFAGGATGRVDALPNVGWDVFEARFFGAFGRIDLTNGGADLASAAPVDELIYPGYAHLAAAPAGKTTPVSGLTALYAAAREHVAAGEPMPGASLDDALLGMAVIDGIRRSASSGGGWTEVRIPQTRKFEA